MNITLINVSAAPVTKSSAMMPTNAKIAPVRWRYVRTMNPERSSTEASATA